MGAHPPSNHHFLGGGNSNIFYFHPYLGKITILTSIFFKRVGSTTNWFRIDPTYRHRRFGSSAGRHSLGSRDLMDSHRGENPGDESEIGCESRVMTFCCCVPRGSYECYVNKFYLGGRGSQYRCVCVCVFFSGK